jgi:hypothetical protein
LRVLSTILIAPSDGDPWRIIIRGTESAARMVLFGIKVCTKLDKAHTPGPAPLCIFLAL